jgi:plastocyanin
MTWLWRICSSLLSVAAVLAAPVSGSVRLTDSQNPVVRKHKDYSGVVVWLEPAAPAGAALSRPLMHARMEQRGKEFIPHVLAIPAGSTVDFPNLDPIFHNAFSEFAGQVFDIGLYAPGASRGITFSRTGIVRVFCNIHPSMSAVIVVMKYPWFAVSGASGDFRMPDVPPGEYLLHLYAERAAEQVLKKLERKVVVPPGGLALGPIAISESGYVETPHKNKYGQDYAPVVDDELYKR